MELIPRSVLFGNPERVSPRLSPDGRRLAFLAPHEGVLNVWVAPVPEGTAGVDWEAARVVTHDKDRGIRVFHWAQDDRHILYLQDAGGDENWRLYDVDLDTGEHRDHTPFEGVQAQILALAPELPDQVLVALNKDNPQLHDVYRLDLGSGALVKEEENPGFASWVADTRLTVRAAVEPRPDGSMAVVARGAPGEEWRPLLELPAEDALSTVPLAVTGDGASLLLVTSVDAETARLERVDLASGERTVLAEDPDVDVTAVRLHPRTHEPQIAIVTRDRAEYLALDASLAEDLAAIRALHPGDPVFEGGDDADASWVVGFTDAAGPIAYYVFDRPSRTGRFLFDHQPALSSHHLAPMEPFSFAARDGLTIHGYALSPVGVERAALPTVLYVHGGPWSRDTWAFDPFGQWFANRGYLCLRVNFRGSTGYGKRFLNAGDREWGAKMHDDLVDAVRFAVGEGWADAARVAIFGGSYGGYAALVGATFTPELFCCAVDVVGPSNLKTLLETIPPYWAPIVAQFNRRVGDPKKDEEFLWSRSPLSRAAEVRVPMLIAQGANDPRVRQAESEQFVAALEKAGIDHEYLLFPDEGHGFAKPENRMRFSAAAERFLAAHLGGRYEE